MWIEWFVGSTSELHCEALLLVSRIDDYENIADHISLRIND